LNASKALPICPKKLPLDLILFELS
jgi:hypothetical protein